MAVHFGYESPERWKQTLTSAEYERLRLFYSLSPFGHEVEDYQNALLCCAVAHSTELDAFRMCKPLRQPKSVETMTNLLVNYFNALGAQCQL